MNIALFPRVNSTGGVLQLKQSAGSDEDGCNSMRGVRNDCERQFVDFSHKLPKTCKDYRKKNEERS